MTQNDDGWICIPGADVAPPVSKKPRKERSNGKLLNSELLDNLFIVGNLHHATTEKELEKAFRKHGTVKDIILNSSVGSASIRMEARQPKHMVNQMNGKVIHGSRISLRHIRATVVNVSNLPSTVSNELLEKALSIFGEVKRAVVIVNSQGQSTTRGIVEYASEESAKMAVQQIQEHCYLLTSSSKPISATLKEHEDSEVGLPEQKVVSQLSDTLMIERQFVPRFPEPGSFEESCALTWKIRLNMEIDQEKQFNEIQQESREKFEDDIAGASRTGPLVPPMTLKKRQQSGDKKSVDEKRNEFVQNLHNMPYQNNAAFQKMEKRFDGIDHWIVKDNVQRQCRQFGCRGKSIYTCEKCGVGLHPECHKDYHQRSGQLDVRRRLLPAYERTLEQNPNAVGGTIVVKQEVKDEVDEPADGVEDNGEDLYAAKINSWLNVELVSSDDEIPDQEGAASQRTKNINDVEPSSGEEEEEWQLETTVREEWDLETTVKEENTSEPVAAEEPLNDEEAPGTSQGKRRRKERKIFECEHCDKSFSLMSHLESHLSTHKKHQPHSENRCEQCGKTFSRSDSYKRHLLLHTGIKSFHCSQCSRGFTQKYLLDRHVKTHQEPKLFKCKYCPPEPGTFFKTKDGIYNHELAHETGEYKVEDVLIRKHACTYCAKRFKKRSHMQRHMLIHTKETPYKCSVCERGFTRKYQLTEHRDVCERQIAELHQYSMDPE